MRRWMPTVLRLGRGMVRYQGAAAEAPAQLLRLWSYESNQFARLVRTCLWLLVIEWITPKACPGAVPTLTPPFLLQLLTEMSRLMSCVHSIASQQAHACTSHCIALLTCMYC